ncbi:MAG: radical SAM protein [Ardenticatenia bacterium]|nr:MAG: radical SAM protein [Ardenticatenia bacterium]
MSTNPVSPPARLSQNWRAPGAVLLLSCYELGHQPFALASPLAWLRAAGYAPRAVDTAVEPLPDAYIEEALFVAISVPMHTAMRLGVSLARRVRAVNPQAHICFFGHYALLNAEHLLATCADSVIGGEYETPLVALVQALEAGETPPAAVRTTPQAHLVRQPFLRPERTSLPPLTRYAHLRVGDRLVPAGYTEATRGCKHTCTHCPITPVYGGRFFAVPVDVVLADIEQQVAAGARHITFGDPDFFNGPTHALRIVRALHAAFPDVTFDATIKVEHLLKHAALLPELRAAGCAFIVSAVESLSDVVLARLQKGHTRADVFAVFDLMEEVGIPLRPSFLPFTPWASLDDYIELVEFIHRRGLVPHVDPVQLSIRLLIPPGSPLIQAPDAALWLGELDADAFTYRWTHPDPRMDALAERVSAVVQQAAQTGEPAEATFARIRALAYETAGRPLEEDDPETHQRFPVVPGLTEAWYC